MKFHVIGGMDTTPVYYRYEDYLISSVVDEWGDPLPGPADVGVRFVTFPVIRLTPKGAWIDVTHARQYDVGMLQEKKFICSGWRKQFACPTQAEAMESFRQRKKSQIWRMDRKRHYAEMALQQIEVMMGLQPANPLFGLSFDK